MFGYWVRNASHIGECVRNGRMSPPYKRRWYLIGMTDPAIALAGRTIAIADL
jgi:hypothetical protein